MSWPNHVKWLAQWTLPLDTPWVCHFISSFSNKPQSCLDQVTWHRTNGAPVVIICKLFCWAASIHCSMHAHLFFHTHTHSFGTQPVAVKLALCGHWMHLSYMDKWRQRTNFIAPGCMHAHIHLRHTRTHRRYPMLLSLQVFVPPFPCNWLKVFSIITSSLFLFLLLLINLLNNL